MNGPQPAGAGIRLEGCELICNIPCLSTNCDLLTQLDVEGYEPAAMRGAAKLLATRRIANIVMEYSPHGEVACS